MIYTSKTTLSLIFTLLLFITSSHVFAQYGGVDQEELAILENSTLVFVYSDSARINNAVEKALKENWTFTKEVEFRTEDELTDIYGNEKYSFLAVRKIVRTKQSSNNLVISYDHYELTLTLAHKKDAKRGKLKFKRVVGWIPLDDKRSSYSGPLGSVNYMPDLIRSLQQFFEFAKQNEKTGQRDAIALYKKRKKEITEKTLLIDKKLVNEKIIRRVQDIEKVYKHPVQLVDTEVILKAIEDKDDSKVYLHVVYLALEGSYITFIEAGTGRILFWDKQSTSGIIRKGLDPNYLKLITLP